MPETSAAPWVPERPARWVWLLTCLALLGLIWLWDMSYLTFTTDDSFYVFLTASHIVQGKGPTFDGVNPTNGFHPLWMVAVLPMVPLAGEDPALLTRIALSVQVVLLWIAILVAVRVPTIASGATLWIASFLLASFFSARVLINGLESALQVLLLCRTLVFWSKWSDDARWALRAVGLGLLSGLTLLARLDAVFFGITLCAMPLLWPGGADRRRSLGSRSAEAALTAAVMALTVAPYFLYNHAAFHHWMPVSGAIKAGARGLRPPVFRWGVSLGCAAFLAAVWAYFRTRRSRSNEGFARLLFPLLVYVALDTAYNAAVRGVLVPEFWYLAPHLLLATLVLGRALEWSRGNPRWVLAGAALAYAVVAIATWVIRIDPRSYASYVGARRAGEWVRRSTPPDALVAGWDCGVAAAHAGRRFMNLDGLINSWDYKERFLDTKRVYEFITEEHPVDYICQPVTLGRWDGNFIGAAVFAHRGWNVVYLDAVEYGSLIKPWRSNVNAYMVLTRKSAGVPFDRIGPLLAGPRPDVPKALGVFQSAKAKERGVEVTHPAPTTPGPSPIPGPDPSSRRRP